MSGLSDAVSDYLAVRRALGFKLAGAGRLLQQFAGYANAAGAERVTTQLALRWATLPPEGSATWHAQRLSTLRCFARWQQTIDPGTEVPPADLLPARTRRATPYLYSEADIAALMTAAGSCARRWPPRPCRLSSVWCSAPGCGAGRCWAWTAATSTPPPGS